MRCIDNETIQYTQYDVGQFYGWHNDAGLANQYRPESLGSTAEGRGQDFIAEEGEMVRKLSFAMQLSGHDDYEGGNVQLIDEKGDKYVAPRQRGSIMLFDSRTMHRVCKVTKGTRKSLVGGVVGPRWK